MDDIVDLVSRSDDELRALIAELEAEERDISRRRRILHGKLDILRAELVHAPAAQARRGRVGHLRRRRRAASRGSSPARARPASRRRREPATTRTPGRADVFCPECGIRNSEGASFCVRCGASLIADQPESATTLSYVPGEEDGETTPFAAVRRRRLPRHPQRRRPGRRDLRACAASASPSAGTPTPPSSSTTSPSRATTRSCVREGDDVGHRRRGQPQRHLRQSPPRRPHGAQRRRRDPDRQVQAHVHRSGGD